MRISFVILVSATVLTGFGVGWSAGCASSFDGNGLGLDDGGGGESGATGPALGAGAGSSTCPECVTDTDCARGSACAQFSGDTFCAPLCGSGNSCAAGRACTIETTYNGEQASVCVPDDDACGQSPPSATPDGGQTTPPSKTGCDAGSPTMCGALVGPGVTAGCSSCSSSSSSCQPNGCYGGWWCDTSTDRCQEAPTSCPSTPCTSSGGGGGSGGGGDSGSAPPPVTGTITGSGGTLSALRFSVVGDTRPANEDDTSGYPTAIIEKIFMDLQAASPSIPFAVSTGDYQFASPTGTQSAPQLALYMAARAMYSGVTFPAMGNHECTGATASNCGPGSADGETPNYDNFLSTMLSPIGKTLPYYSVNINSSTGAWTSKFVFIAGNAWDSAQSSWLSGVLAVSTTYTFVIRHEATEADTAPGVTPSDSIISSYPLTLEINGHTHTYEWSDTNKVIVGNGGAPLTGSGDYGYALIQQQTNGDITIDMIDYESGTADSSFHRELTPTGAEAP
jgi:hypothetical protein